ncbi:MAG: hypothetical protein COB33_005665 [Thiotrichaceae bacterium]|nr:hypothetical protein [Thiotrichaceae bacterium]
MKQLKVIYIAVGLTASVFATTAQADAYTPLTADRYHASPITPLTVTEKPMSLKSLLDSEVKQGFQPFSASRYKVAPFKVTTTIMKVSSDSDVSKRDGTGFKAHGANRY